MAYQHLYDWPTGVDPATKRLVLAVSENVNAIGMRAELGMETQSLLSQQMLAGPVIALPGDRPEWIFLTGPATSISTRTLTALSHLGIRLQKPGAFIPLPPSRVGSGVARWASGPTVGRELPPWTAVLAATRSASSSSMCGAR
ncbi:bifunctional DNA primase/polymerase [Kibdelosporangium philippinense]|uniref:Bifunctional DNA primase/polymerase n=2 Tax=Kibdelosporangium philippinense TaxID=211113 RepID=A0ABS8Z2I3_9PSEU|nr:bifunctional DNA primase/polymerase [Kibdelosporangium philippinense]MCE7002149.1 bifunctional DNA primase/polymerase [Kibdelosporangium philippinense]